MNENPIHKTVENVKDTIDEAGHRSAAAGEHATRDAAGDAMSPGEKAKSVVREGSERIQGEIDAAKRTVRNQT